MENPFDNDVYESDFENEKLYFEKPINVRWKYQTFVDLRSEESQYLPSNKKFDGLIYFKIKGF